MSNKFSIKLRVYFEDTDAGGIVYHANYLKFTERARTEWLRQLNFSQQKLLENKEGFVVSKLSCAFRKSANLDDTLTVTCVPIQVRRASISFYQEVFNQDGDLIFELTCSIAYVDLKDNSVKVLDDNTMSFAKSQIPHELPQMGIK